METRIRTIVAGVADVNISDAVLGSAIELAKRTDASLHFVHAFELPDPLLSAYAREGLLGADFGARQREALEAKLEARVRELTDSGRIEFHAVNGPASEVLCEQAENLGADLLVVGASRAGKFLRTILGSTAERVIRGARMPVLVLRHPITEPPRRVLLTTDLSEYSKAVHEQGLDLIEATFPGGEPELRSLLVVWYDMAFPPPLKRDSLKDVAANELQSFLGERGANVEPAVRIGDPSKEINVEAAEWGADLLLLGTRSRGGRTRFLLGSVAEATIRTATTNVLIVPPRALADAAPGHGEAGETATPDS